MQSLRDREHLLKHWQAGKDAVRQKRGCLHHASRVAGGADAPTFAGIGHEVVVPAVIAFGPGKALGKDAAFQILAKLLADIGFGHVVVALEGVETQEQLSFLRDCGCAAFQGYLFAKPLPVEALALGVA